MVLILRRGGHGERWCLEKRLVEILETGLSRKVGPCLWDWDNTLGLDMREEGTEEGEGECATFS